MPVSTTLSHMDDSRAAGQRLARALPADGLRAVLLFGRGVQINGSAVLEGVVDVLGRSIPLPAVWRGRRCLAQTWILDGEGASSERLTCVGLYGEQLVFAHGSFGGWSPFGPARKVTRCANNVLFELDGESALEVYKRYLGEHAKGFTGLGFTVSFCHVGQGPFRSRADSYHSGVDEANGSLTLAGDIDPEGYLRLMHASTDALVEGAEAAAEAAQAMRG